MIDGSGVHSLPSPLCHSLCHPPCHARTGKAIAPHFDKLSVDHPGIKFMKLNIETPALSKTVQGHGITAMVRGVCVCVRVCVCVCVRVCVCVYVSVWE